MSLIRFKNRDSFLKLNEPQYGQTLSEANLNVLSHEILIPTIGSLNLINNRIISETHVYTFAGDFIGSSINTNVYTNTDNKNIFINVKQVFDLAGIRNGSYKIVFNLIHPVYGRPSAEDSKNIYWPAVVKEISPDRTEVKFAISDRSQILAVQQFRDYVQTLSELDILNNLVVNFGSNRINKIINIKFDKVDQSVFYIKLYNEIDESVNDLDRAWFGIELMDSYIDTVLLTTSIQPGETNQLRGPKFNIDVDDFDSNSTIFQSWNDLLQSDAPTSQRIIDNLLSGSGTATLNIDYTNFENYIFYSSAEERIENFKYKLTLAEQYNAEILNWQLSSGSASYHTAGLIDGNKNKLSNITTTLDPFERWLYYHGTGSIFTHDISGSQSPYPKFISGSQYYLYSVTSSQGIAWHSSSLAAAQIYDKQNTNSFWWSIPEHILMDPNNSDYVLFVQMIGQHFDTLYSYINAMAQIHSRDEHPERGPSNELLWYIAKHFGWDLQNTRQLSSLWLYKLGSDESGSMQTSNDMDVLPHENQTKQIWRRIVNNLPYLLKTKGTSRSVKALMSIYGIPQTLISIKEYGGPGLDAERPIYTEDRFQYKLLVGSGSYVKTARDLNSYSYNGWKGNASWSPSSSNLAARDPDTIEFRFDTKISGSSGSAVLFAYEDSGSLYHVSIQSPVTVGSNILVSGSNEYGRLLFEFQGNGSGSYTKYIPIFDQDIWTVRIHKDPLQTGSFKTVYLDVARASDALYGRISHQDTISVNVSSSFFTTASGNYYLGGVPTNIKNRLYSGSVHGLGFIDPYYGYIQAYKEYYTTYSHDTYLEHVQNPGAYHVDTISGSYYSLYKYYPLGLDQQRYDHYADMLYMSSSHPDQSVTSSRLNYVGFTGDQTTQYETDQETFYIQVPTLGGNVLQSQKLRIEDNELKFDLSPDSHGEQSKYDERGIDTNRLAIVFSITDQINRDIYNHMGFESLDPWIADPQEEFETEYVELTNRRKEYFQKYQRKNDINAFIRILSVYDYTFFEQIKQLTPGRADLIAGILIEPSVLERSKVQISRRPTITNPQWETELSLRTVSQSGDYPNFEVIVPVTSSLCITSDYYSGSHLFTSSICITSDYYSGSHLVTSSLCISSDYYSSSIPNPNCVTGSRMLTRDWYGCIEVRDPYSGSVGCTQSIFEDHRIKCGYYRKIFYYDVSNVTDRYQRDWHIHVSKSNKQHSSSSLERWHYQYEECSDSNKSRYQGSKLTGAGINIDSANTIDGGPVVVIKESNPNSIFTSRDGSEGNIKLE